MQLGLRVWMAGGSGSWELGCSIRVAGSGFEIKGFGIAWTRSVYLQLRTAISGLRCRPRPPLPRPRPRPPPPPPPLVLLRLLPVDVIAGKNQ